MTHADLAAFLRSHKMAVEATVSAHGMPQAAVIGFAVTDGLELVFDTLESTRKAANLRRHPRVALVVGGAGGEPRTLQYEGVADFPAGDELERLKQLYFGVFPDGPDRLAWPGITYLRVRPRWIRFSDYTTIPPTITEFQFDES